MAELISAAAVTVDAEAGPAQPHAAGGVAHLAAGRTGEALAALRTAVTLGDRSPATMLNLALATDRAGDRPLARRLMREVQMQLPAWDEPALRLAESFRDSGELDAADAAYVQVLLRNPNRQEALIALAMLKLRRGEPLRAQIMLLRCCGLAPDRMQAWDALGMALMLTADAGAAEQAFAEAQRLAPGSAAIALRRVDAAIAAGSGAAELARLEAASLVDPLDAVLLTARGVLLERLGRRDEAIDILDAATILAPGLIAPANALAHVLVRSTRMGPAMQALDRAIALSPDDADLRNNRAAVLVRLHRHREAASELEALIAEHGERASFLCNLTNALISQGLQEEGLRTARRAVALAPRENLAWRTLCNALPYCDGCDAVELLDAYRHAGATLPRGPRATFDNSPDPARRIRLGLLSTSLKTHPVGWLTLAGFEALDERGFEIVCLAQPESADALQRRFRAIAAEWHVADRQDATARAAWIRGLGIDVLIELSGYGDQGLMTLCAEHLAPVQVKWVGSQNHSTGLAEMDWFITDRWETPGELAQFYSERLLTLPDGYVCYSPPVYAPDVAALPMHRNGTVTFGCFNNLAKITARVIATWAAILDDLPTARLVLKCHQFNDAAARDPVQDAFAGHGIGAERIELRGSSPHRVLLDQYNDIDIVLDPFPYSGGLTTCEALWMGVPVITMPGQTFASRHSASHLSNAGLADWVAADLPAYRALARRWAGQPDALAALRTGMRARLRASPLCDAPRFGRGLAAALRHVWADWCARQ